MLNKTRKKDHKYNLELLFESVLDKSYQLRSANPLHFDGQGFWQPIKKILEPFDSYPAKQWKTLSKTKTRKIMLLPEYTINGYETKEINENNHFIIQQVRIPLKDSPTIKKIIQVALNIGQYKGTNKQNFMYDVKLDSIQQFIHKADIIELSKHISDETVENIKDYLASTKAGPKRASRRTVRSSKIDVPVQSVIPAVNEERSMKNSKIVPLTEPELIEPVKT